MWFDWGWEEGEWDGMRKLMFDMICKLWSVSIWRVVMMFLGYGINFFILSVVKSCEVEFIDSSFKYRNI